MDSTIKVEANGDLTFLYHDDHPCLGMGKLDVKRASNVRYNSSDGLWYVFLIDPLKSDLLDEVSLPKGHKRRADAIQYEINFLEAELAV